LSYVQVFGDIPGAVAGQILPAIRVSLADAYYNPVDELATIIASGLSGFSGGTTTVMSTGGIAVFDDLVLRLAGTYDLAASASGKSSVGFTPLNVGVPAGSRLVIKTPSQNSDQFVGTVSVDVLDAQGKLLGGTPQLRLSFGNSLGQLGTLTQPANDGVATVNGLGWVTTPGAYTVTAGAPGAAGMTVNFTVAAGTPVALRLVGGEGTVKSGEVYPDLNVQVVDWFGNVADVAVPVTLTGATIPVTVTTTHGVAIFSGLVFAGAGTADITASSPGLISTGPYGSAVNVVAGPASKAQTTYLPPALAGQPVGPIFVVITDEYGNAPSISGMLTLTASMDGAPVVSVTAPLTGNGATFFGLVLPKPGDYNLVVAGSGLSASVIGTIHAGVLTTSNQLGASGGQPAPLRRSPANLHISSMPTHNHAGHYLAPLKLQIRDASGRHVGAGILVRIRVAEGYITGLLTRRTNSVGAVNFTGLKIRRPGHYTLLISVTGLKRPLSRSLVVLSR
jgi:hypothetical protein